jgi:hypothetical protein
MKQKMKRLNQSGLCPLIFRPGFRQVNNRGAVFAVTLIR